MLFFLIGILLFCWDRTRTWLRERINFIFGSYRVKGHVYSKLLKGITCIEVVHSSCIFGLANRTIISTDGLLTCRTVPFIVLISLYEVRKITPYCVSGSVHIVLM